MEVTQPPNSTLPPDQAVDLTESENEADTHFEPRGAFIFTSLMLAGFAIYFFLVWLEFTMRGGA